MNENISNSFSKEMRIHTRKIHKISDDLVNAKLAFAMSDNKIWAEGLIVFYEIFAYLEKNVPSNILPSEFHRKSAFEKDLNVYLGPNWLDTYKPRKSVEEYVSHLEKVRNKNPTLLLAYVYHLYMGLLSGGQILQKKRSLAQKLNPFSSTLDSGCEVTRFEIPINELKQIMRYNVDTISEHYDDDLKRELLEESLKCFEFNNRIVRSIEGVNLIGIQKILYISVIIIGIWLMYKKILQ